MKETGNPVFFVSLGAACLMSRSQQGGCDRIRTSGVTKPYSSIYFIPLWLSPLNRTSRADPEKAGRTRATPTKTRRSCGPDSGAE